MRNVWGFPDPVDEVSARLVAAGVVLMAAVYLVSGNVWVLAAMTFGFLARVLSGPTLSPLGTLVTRVVRPRIPAAPRYVPGPPKRFAQAMGFAMTAAALVLQLSGFTGVALGLVGVLAVCAVLESALGFCLGCTIFGLLMRAGVIPAETCARCADLWGIRQEKAT